MTPLSEYEEQISKALTQATSSGRRGFLKSLAKGFAFLSGLAVGTPREFLGQAKTSGRVRRLLDDDWRFIKGDPQGNPVSLLYDMRPQPVRVAHRLWPRQCRPMDKSLSRGFFRQEIVF
jgi:hypothetical protein